MAVWPGEAEWEELGRIDYFLDHLARAVERGDVPRESYDALAPRYLSRRSDLIAMLYGPQAISAAAATAGTVESPHESGPRITDTHASRRQPVRSSRERRPVAWTTVLLFLGAFLVVVAAAIFTFALWDESRPFLNLIMMAAFTGGFYAGGWFAHAKMRLRTGAVALTAVASAMLLFDCWIVIDGYGLPPEISWSVALLVCSLAYWYTEVRLSERFFGVIGAAAQVGWWWLLGAGLGVPQAARFAGLAAVALGWHLVSRRARADSVVGPLASVLSVGAPVLASGAVLGLSANLLRIGYAGWPEAVYAAVAALSAGMTLRTTPHVPQGREWLAALAQAPLFVAVFAGEGGGWPGVVLLVVMAVAYDLVGILDSGLPFVAIGLVSELLALLAFFSAASISGRPVTLGIVVLATLWTMTAFLGRLGFADRLDLKGLRDTIVVADIAGAVALVAGSIIAFVSISEPFRSLGWLASVNVEARDAWLAMGVAVCWIAATFFRREWRATVTAAGAVLWSMLAAVAALHSMFPAENPATYALAPVAVGAAWMTARIPVRRTLALDATVLGWLARAAIIVWLVAGVSSARHSYEAVMAPAVVLAAVVAIVFAADAALAGPAVSAGIAAVVSVLVAYLAPGLATSVEMYGPVSAAAVGALVAFAAFPLRPRSCAHARWLAASAVVAGTLGALVSQRLGYTSMGLALACLGWIAASILLEEQAVVLAAGLVAFASLVFAIAAWDPAPWVAVAALAGAGALLGVPAARVRTGPGGALARSGAALAIAGGAGLVSAALLASAAAARAIPTAHWNAFTEWHLAALLAALGGYVVAQSWRWRLEPGLYLGFGCVLLAAWSVVGALDLSRVEYYTTPLALYLVAMGYLFAAREPQRRVPLPVDAAAVLIGLGAPVLQVLTTPSGPDSAVHTAWALGLGLLAVGAGIVGRVRAYLYGGTATVVIVSVWRTATYLAEFWWLVLGFVGTVMLIIALTWERQRVIVAETGRRLRDTFDGWR